MQDARLATEGIPRVEIKQRGGSLIPAPLAQPVHDVPIVTKPGSTHSIHPKQTWKMSVEELPESRRPNRTP